MGHVWVTDLLLMPVQANVVWTQTQDPIAVALQLRAAFKICPTCRAQNTANTYVSHIFYYDDYVDRLYMANEIFPQLFLRKPKELLWVGVQPFNLRIECAATTCVPHHCLAAPLMESCLGMKLSHPRAEAFLFVALCNRKSTDFSSIACLVCMTP